MSARAHPAVAAAATYTITDVGTFGRTVSQAFGIDSSGQVVGEAATGSRTTDAFLYSNATLTDLGTLGGIDSVALGISPAGRQIVGEAHTSSGEGHAFLYRDGQMMDLGTLGGNLSVATGVNDAGQISGYSILASNSYHAFLYDNDHLVDLGTLGGSDSYAQAVNAAGQVVGNSSIASGAGHAFLYRDGTMTDLGTLGGDRSAAGGINVAGQVVGSARTGSGEDHAFLHSDGAMADLGTLGGIFSQASSINAAGRVVGIAYTGTGDAHAFLYMRGVMLDLNTLLPPNSGWLLNHAFAINDEGDIVGDGTLDGELRGFLLTPNDTTPPTIVITGVQEGGSYTNTVTATIDITDTGSGVDPTKTSVTLNGQPYTSGTAITAAGAYTLVVNAADQDGNPAGQTVHFRVKHSTALAYSGATSGGYDDPANLAAVLTDTWVSPAAPIGAASLSLGLGSQTCTATTDGGGKGSCTLTPNEQAGGYPLTATFAGNDLYLPSSSAAGAFTVNKEETALAINSAPALAAGKVTVTAVLKEDGNTPISGRNVTFTAGGSSATGTTDGSGTASATLPVSPGKYALRAAFAGDGYYQAASATAQTLYAYQPTQFVIWGGNPPIPSGQPANVAVGQDYTFCGAQWAKQVTGGDFRGNSSFKGYADSVTGGTWTGSSGNSGNPPASAPSYIGVIVTTQATKSGGTTSGNVAEIAVLQVDNPASYAPNPGHAGTGTLVAIVQ